ncbi:MAG: dockerin type I domain-containing protein, partial [Planctomycetota bacterium]
QTTVSVDATGFDGNDFARLEAYDASGRLLLRTTSQSLASQQTETLTVSRDQADIAYVVAKPHISGSAVVFDRLQFGAITSTKTAVGGSYRLPSLPAGDYTVRATPPAGFTLTGPTPGNIQVTLGAGEASSSVDFGAQGVANTWHNSNLPEDVNDDQVVVPLDALLVVNDLNLYGSRALPSPGVGPQAPPPYLDVNADGFISPIDALRIINRLNGGSGGEASASASASLNTSTSDAALLGYLTVPGDEEEHHHHHDDEELHDQDWALGAVPENKLDATKLTPPSISPPATSDIDTALSQLILTPRSFFRRWLAR